jgi:hypothetical protein
MNPKKLNTFDEYSEYFTHNPWAWANRDFVDNFIHNYKNKMNDILELFERGTAEQVIKDIPGYKDLLVCLARDYLLQRKSNLEAIRTGKEIDDCYCGECGIVLRRINVAGGGSYAPDCPECSKMLCKKCARVEDGQCYCHVCYAQVAENRGDGQENEISDSMDWYTGFDSELDG